MKYEIIETGFIPIISYPYINLINRFTTLKYGRCINRGEPAAVSGCPLIIKVVELIRPESAAVGSLFGFLPQSSQRAQRKEKQFIGHWWEGLVR
jgi:hypothetical protein